MGLIEGVGRKLLHRRPESGHGLGWKTALPRLPEESLLEGGIPSFFFQTASKLLALLGRHSGDTLGDLHDLFLVEEDAARFGQNAFQEGIALRGLPFSAPEDGLLHAAFRRSGTDESQGLGEIEDVPRLHPAQEIHHSRAFDLKTSDRPGLADHPVDGGIVAGIVQSARRVRASETAASPRTERRSSLMRRRSSTASRSKWHIRSPLADFSRGR